MLSEMCVRGVVPDGSAFIGEYLQHSHDNSTTPLAYSLAVALSLLGAVCPPALHDRYAGRLHANLFVLAVGRSGLDRKSTAVNLGRDLLLEVDPTLIGAYPGSEEGLVESLAAQSRQVIVMSEFGKFLANAQKGYFEKIKATLTDLWDCTPTTRALARGRMVSVTNPRLSIMAGCSLPYLEKYTLSEDWSGGFMGRWIIMHAHEERHEPNPVGNDSRFSWLKDFLTELYEVRDDQLGRYAGLDSQAEKYWENWYYELHTRRFPSKVAGVQARVPTMARKAALIYAWERKIPLQKPTWKMDAEAVHFGIQFAELHLRSVLSISEVLVDHPDARLRRQVIGILASEPEHRATLGQILAATQLRKKPVVETLDALLEEGRIEKMSVQGKHQFILVAQAAPPPEVLSPPLGSPSGAGSSGEGPLPGWARWNPDV